MKEIFVRNRGLISPEFQREIEKVRILMVGCGLGSQIAVLAARTGFARFELWDGDKVEEHNLNRQAFSGTDVGLNKTETTARLLRAINPEVEVEARPQFLTTREEIAAAVASADLVVNTADPQEAVYLIDEIVARQGRIPSFFPMNVGFGGFVLVFTPKSQRLEEMVGGRILGDECFAQVLQAAVPFLPQSFQCELERLKAMWKKGEIPPIPQLGMTTYLTSTLVVNAMVRWLAEDTTLSVAPQPLWLDIRR